MTDLLSLCSVNWICPSVQRGGSQQERGIQGKTKPFRERKGFTGVANAARTRDLLNHNQMLYQLSYGHHSVVFSKLNSHNR